jgi:8-oxo-dGTP pyrophosphatase MutT (NUDIX family)
MQSDNQQQNVRFGMQLADAKTLVRLNVAVLIRDEHLRVLLERRRDCGLWGLPGGRIEAGESVAQAACREVFEETGFRVTVNRLLGIYSEPRDRIVAFPDKTVQIVDILLEAEVLSGELRISDESEEMRFFATTEFPPEVKIIPPARAVLLDIVAGRVGVIR